MSGGSWDGRGGGVKRQKQLSAKENCRKGVGYTLRAALLSVD